VLAGTLAAAVSGAGVAAAVPAGATETLKDSVCHFAWWQGPAKVKDTIRCAARRWEVKGGAKKALRVADCESSFNPRAKSEKYGGVYQHLISAWPDRAAFYGFEKTTSVFNGRANTIVAIRMAHRAENWAAWAGCA
jgi:hypothetical protein